MPAGRERAGSQVGVPPARQGAAIPTAIPATRTPSSKFKELNEAYEALKDPQKRAAYDQFGHAAFDGTAAAAAHGFGPDFASSMSDIFDDLFGEFMGGRRGGGGQRTGRERGADLRYNMEITLPEAFAGKTAQIRVPTSVTCETCTGTGAKRRHPAVDLPDLRAATARCAPARASSPSSAPAPPARAAARSSTIPAAPATARAA